MSRAYWTKQREEAERELEAAKGRTAINAAAKKLARPSFGASVKAGDLAPKDKGRHSIASVILVNFLA